MAYKKRLINKLREIEDELQTFKRMDSANPERVLINAALFITAISSLDEARNRARPDGYEQKSKYLFYQDTVSGPCYELFKKMSKDSHGDKEDRKVSSGNFITLAKQATGKFESTLAKGSIENYKNSNEGMNYSVLYEDIAKIESVKLKNIMNLNIPGLLELVIDCYEDMLIRVTEYNNKQRKKSAKKRLIDKAKTKETGEMQGDEDEDKKTNITFSVSRSGCNNTILKLHSAYKELEKREDNNSKLLKERLEQILIPVYSTSPYFVLCIAHKNMLPEDILKNYQPKRSFIFVIVAVTYEYNNTDSRQEYSVSYNVVSEEYVRSIRNLSLDIQSVSKKINKSFYTDATSGICCADLYNNMIFKYKCCCKLFNQELAWRDAEMHWLPLDLPNGIFKDLKSLLGDTNHFEYGSLLRETEEFGKDVLLDNEIGNQYYNDYKRHNTH